MDTHDIFLTHVKDNSITFVISKHILIGSFAPALLATSYSHSYLLTIANYKHCHDSHIAILSGIANPPNSRAATFLKFFHPA